MTPSDTEKFSEILQKGWPELDPVARSRVEAFYLAVLTENEQQNLTRLLSPTDFFEGHVWDVRELLKSGLLDYPALDLGSGGGVPGLLAAMIDGERWILAESEARKAEFLSNTAKKLERGSVSVYSGRAETFLAKSSVGSVVARAVGPVERIYGWIRKCSTWNNLVLLKGPGWTEEWKRFEEGGFAGELAISSTHEYRVGEKYRIIVKLSRVPRGTQQ